MLLVGGIWLDEIDEKLHRKFRRLTRLAIIVGAMIVSGVISYFLFPKDEGEK